MVWIFILFITTKKVVKTGKVQQRLQGTRELNVTPCYLSSPTASGQLPRSWTFYRRKSWFLPSQSSNPFYHKTSLKMYSHFSALDGSTSDISMDLPARIYRKMPVFSLLLLCQNQRIRISWNTTEVFSFELVEMSAWGKRKMEGKKRKTF